MIAAVSVLEILGGYKESYLEKFILKKEQEDV
jgi:hypothetical protein